MRRRPIVPVLGVLSALAVVLPASPAHATATGSVQLLAGGGVVDGGPATAAALGAFDAVQDSVGNWYVADRTHNRVRKVDANTGVISTLVGAAAGDGTGAFAGDGGPAYDAQLNAPTRVQVLPSGDVVIADVGNHRVRAVNHATGTITTIAGNGLVGSGVASADATSQAVDPQDIAVDPNSGDLYIADPTNAVVWVRHLDGSLAVFAGRGSSNPLSGGSATDVRLSHPEGVAVMPGGDVLLSDELSGAVYRVHLGVLDTVAGHGASYAAEGLSAYDSLVVQAQYMTVTPDGTIYVSGSYDKPWSFTIGGALHAVSSAPCALLGRTSLTGRVTVACDPVFLQQPDGSFSRLAGSNEPRSVNDHTPDGTIPANAAYTFLRGVAEINGKVTYSTAGSGTVDYVGSDGLVHRLAGTGVTTQSTGDGGPALSAQLQDGGPLAQAPSGGVFVVDADRIRLVQADGTISTIAGVSRTLPFTEGEPATAWQGAATIAIASAPSGDLFVPDYASEGGLGAVRVIRWTDRTVHTVVPDVRALGGHAPAGWFEDITGFAVEPSGNLLVASREYQMVSYQQTHLASRIRRVDPSTGAWSSVYYGPLLSSLAAGNDGDVYVATNGVSPLVERLGAAGDVTTIAGGGNTVADGSPVTAVRFGAQFGGLSMSADGGLLVASSVENRGRVQKIEPGFNATAVGGVTAGGAQVTTADGGYLIHFSWTPPASAPAGAQLSVQYAQGASADPVPFTSGGSQLAVTAQSTDIHYATPGMRYIISVYVTTPNGDRSAPTTLSAIVPGDTTAPPGVQSWQGYSGDSTATFTWTNPIANDLAAVDVRVAAGTTLPTATAPQFSGVSGRATIGGLTPGVTYTVSFTARDFDGNQAQPIGGSFVAGSAPDVRLTLAPAANGWTGSSTHITLMPSLNGTPVCTLDSASVGCTSFDVVLSNLSQGPHVFTAVASNDLGTGALVSRSWNVDRTNPSATPPTVTPFTTGSTLTPRWSGSDKESGVANYDVRYRTFSYKGAASAFSYPATWQHLAATSKTLSSVTPGFDYCFSVRSRDRAGNVSSWSAERCSAVALDDRVLGLSSGWSRRTASGYYKGTYTGTSTLGAKATLGSISATKIGLVATRCPTCGSVRIYAGSTLLKTISLASSTTQRQWQYWFTSSLRTGTLTLQVATSGRPVTVDGLLLARL